MNTFDYLRIWLEVASVPLCNLQVFDVFRATGVKLVEKKKYIFAKNYKK